MFLKLAMAFIEGGKKKDEVQHFKKALEINPNFAEAKKMLKKIINRSKSLWCGRAALR
tara:strand:+ start:315 stop:488 length:174 start_codon:yes stop_codon:yes gene_type:complete